MRARGVIEYASGVGERGRESEQASTHLRRRHCGEPCATSPEAASESGAGRHLT